MNDLTRRTFLKSGAAAATASIVPEQLGAMHGRRNVLFIGIDDLNHSLGCYGQPVHTPHMDALAARGVRFDAAYCQYPLCAPSRTSLMSGLAPDTTHVYDLRTGYREAIPNATSIAELFRKNGYFAARVGKIFHEGNPFDIGKDGADDPQSWDYRFNDIGIDKTEQLKDVTFYSAPVKTSLGASTCGYPSPSPDRQITDSLGADEIIRLLKENKNKPFFIAYGLWRPHVPWIVPRAYYDQYPLESLHAEPFDPAEMHQAPPAAYNSDIPNLGMTDELCRKSKQGYYASTTFIDVQIGRVLAALKDLGLEENTVVVLWADHGWQLGQHGQWEKQTVFEWSARVPFLMAGPGITGGGVMKRPTEHLDIYPTLVDLCGLENAPKIHGTSLAGVLGNAAGAPWSKPALTQVKRGGQGIDGYSIRTERYRYTVWEGKETGEELYDYQTDPREIRNRAADPSMGDVKTKLKAQLAQMREARTTPGGPIAQPGAKRKRLEE